MNISTNINDYELLDNLEESKCIGCIEDCSSCPYIEGSQEQIKEERLY